jgi:DNA-binding NarL/FixJ family response regulator
MEMDVFSAAVVGDQPMSRAGMEKLVSDDPTLEVVTSVDAIEQLDRTYDLVVLDLPLRGRSTTPEVIAAVARIGRPLVCSSWDQPLTLLSAIRAGARGCITPHTEQCAVREAMRTVAQGGFYLCSGLVGRFQTELAKPLDEDPSGLAPREIETLRWIAIGLTHTQIATRMGLSPATVNTYAKRIRSKLNVRNKAELTRMAIELGHLSEHRRYRAA